ncbi:hypothetical protein ACFE04_012562 [Oxalis oulophora]
MRYDETQPPVSPVKNTEGTTLSDKSTKKEKRKEQKASHTGVASTKLKRSTHKSTKASQPMVETRSKSQQSLKSTGKKIKGRKTSQKPTQSARKTSNSSGSSSTPRKNASINKEKDEGNSKRKRKVTWDLRGTTQCLKLRNMRKRYGKVSIAFNRYMTPRGPNRKLYSSFVGMNVRKIIPINVRSWDLVDEFDKEQLWMYIEDMFEIECDMKWALFNHAANLWRGWKSRLNTYDVQPFRYTDPDKLKDVPKWAKGYVTPEAWAEFVEWVTSPEFDLISERMQQRRNDQRNQARVGRKGMTGCNDEHMEDGDEEPDRADSWMWARMNPAGGFDDPDIQVIVDEILRLKAKQKSGELVLGDNEDILSIATGVPIKARKIQACGFNATKTMLVPSKRMIAASAELIRLRRIVKEFEDGERAKGGKNFTPKKNNDAEEALAASQKKVAELEKKLADYYKSQEPYILEYVNVDDHKKTTQEDESTDSEGDFGKTDKFEADQTDLPSFFNPKLAKFPDSFPGKFTRGPYYPNEYLDTEVMDDIFNEKKIIR